MIFWLGTSASAIERMTVDASQDTSYLSHRFAEIPAGATASAKTKNQYHPVRIYSESPDINGIRWLMTARNSPPGRDLPAIFGRRDFPDFEKKLDDAVHLTVNDYILYDDLASGLKALVGAGYKNDTACVFKFYPEADSLPLTDRFIAAGTDATGDGQWEPSIYSVLSDDYDLDGQVEVFFYMTSHHDAGPRRLYCVEVESLTLEWEIDVATQIPTHNQFFFNSDSLRATVAFVSIPHFQGHSDANFDENFGYFSIINNRGELVVNKIGTIGSGAIHLVPGEAGECYYISHQIPLTEPDSILSLSKSQLEVMIDNKWRISKVDPNGKILKVKEIDQKPISLWLQTFGPDSRMHLYVRHPFGAMSVYDLDLSLKGMSPPSRIGSYLGSLNMPGYENAWVCTDGIYSSDLIKLIHFPREVHYFESLVVDSNNSVTTLVIGWTNGWAVGHLEKRSSLDLLAVFYVKNKVYGLMILSSLLAGLVIMNFYRRRAKHDYQTITRQKVELETTHMALKKAQQQIVAQEKFRQARDIAGGFAHEIRNALFPARSALNKLTSINKTPHLDPEQVKSLSKFTDEAIVRAIDLTKKVSWYSNLESARAIEIVDVDKALKEGLNANQMRIAENKIAIERSGESDHIVAGNHDHLVMVFNNLLINALDALTGVDKPLIIIEQNADDGFLAVRFTDNGPGIPPEDVSRVFEMFFSTKSDTGTGLGLPMVKKIVEMYGGSVEVKNNHDKGTSFELHLKLISSD